jgi:hypothetical protein
VRGPKASPRRNGPWEVRVHSSSISSIWQLRGCGCGFNFGREYWVEDDPEHLKAAQESVAELVRRYVRDAGSGRFTVAGSMTRQKPTLQERTVTPDTPRRISFSSSGLLRLSGRFEYGKRPALLSLTAPRVGRYPRLLWDSLSGYFAKVHGVAAGRRGRRAGSPPARTQDGVVHCRGTTASAVLAGILPSASCAPFPF